MKLDLHGVKHENVTREIDNFLWECMNKKVTQIEIITGNSSIMRELVDSCISEYGFSVNPHFTREGSILVDLT